MGNTPNKKHGVSYLEIDQLDKTNTDYKYVDGSEKKEQLTVLQIIAQTYFGINANELKEKYDTDGLIEYYIKRDYSKALEIFTEKKNYLMLGNMYCFGRGVVRDYTKAIYFYQKAIDTGCSCAVINMGNMYYNGREVDQNYTIAIKYYQKAVLMGNSVALVEMGDMHYYGKGVEQDEYKALEYYKKAMIMGNSNALVEMGNMHYHGKGVKKNEYKAVEYFQQALAMGNIDAIKYLENMSHQCISICVMNKQHRLEKTINQINKSLNDLNQKIDDIVDYCSDNATVIIN